MAAKDLVGYATITWGHRKLAIKMDAAMHLFREVAKDESFILESDWRDGGQCWRATLLDPDAFSVNILSPTMLALAIQNQKTKEEEDAAKKNA